MRKQILLVHTCLVGVLLTSCTAQRVATQEISQTATPLPPTESPFSIALFRGNSQRTGVYNLPGIRNQPEVKWQAKVSSTWLMPPLLAEDILYTGSGEGVLYALNAETGEQIWSVDGFGQLESTGAVGGDLIVSAGYSQLVKAMDRSTGEERWSYQADYPVQGAPLIVGERVYIATDRQVYALELESGQLIWKDSTGTEDAYMGAPAYEDGVIYTTGGKILLALDAETGKELWRAGKANPFLGLAVVNQMIYVGNWDERLYAFDRSTGEERWSFAAQAGGLFWSSPAATSETVYAGNIDGYIYALDAQTGELKWSFQTGGDAVSEALVSDGIVYVSDSSHETRRGPRHLYAIDAATGKQIWVFESESTFLPAPELGNGTIYVTSTGEVIALK